MDDLFTEPIYLNCYNCDHPTCRFGEIVHEDDKDGCIRTVPLDLFIEYNHQLNEVWSMRSLLKSKDKFDKCYNDTIDVIYKVLKCPIKKIYGHSQKIPFDFN